MTIRISDSAMLPSASNVSAALRHRSPRRPQHNDELSWAPSISLEQRRLRGSRVLFGGEAARGGARLQLHRFTFRFTLTATRLITVLAGAADSAGPATRYQPLWALAQQRFLSTHALHCRLFARRKHLPRLHCIHRAGLAFDIKHRTHQSSVTSHQSSLGLVSPDYLTYPTPGRRRLLPRPGPLWTAHRASPTYLLLQRTKALHTINSAACSTHCMPSHPTRRKATTSICGGA